mgnify:CR=1 FL=1
MELYDKGSAKAWLELFRVFAGEKEEMVPGNIGILGMTPQDISDLRAADRIRERFAAEGKEKTGTEAAKAEGRERGPVGERAERSFSPCRRQEKRTGRDQPPDLRASYENLPDDPGSHSGGTGAAGKRAGI